MIVDLHPRINLMGVHNYLEASCGAEVEVCGRAADDIRMRFIMQSAEYTKIR